MLWSEIQWFEDVHCSLSLLHFTLFRTDLDYSEAQDSSTHLVNPQMCSNDNFIL